MLRLQAQTISCMAWSMKEQTLAAATHQGSLVLFMVGLRKREVFPGKHSKAVTCLAWSATGLLSMAGRDNKVPAALHFCLDFFQCSSGLLDAVLSGGPATCAKAYCFQCSFSGRFLQVSILWGTDGSLLRLVTLRREACDLQFAPALPGVTSTSGVVLAGTLGSRSIILAEVPLRAVLKDFSTFAPQNHI